MKSLCETILNVRIYHVTIPYYVEDREYSKTWLILTYKLSDDYTFVDYKSHISRSCNRNNYIDNFNSISDLYKTIDWTKNETDLQ